MRSNAAVARRAVGLVAATGAVVLVASACSSNSSSSPSSSPSQSQSDNTACLVGGWSVDMRLAAENAGAVIPGVSGRQATGTINLGFTESVFTATFNMTLTGEHPASGDLPATKYLVDFKGGSTADYSGNSSTLAMTNGRGRINVSGTQTVNGTPSPITDLTVFRPIGNFTQGTLAYTCNGGNLILTNQSGVALNATRKV